MVFSGVCKEWTLGATLVPFWTRIEPKLGQNSVFRLFYKRFPLDSHETFFKFTGSTFKSVWNMDPGSHILGFFSIPNRAKIGQKSVFRPFCQKFPLDSHPSIHIHFRLRCCPCPIQWGWQHQAMSNTSSLSISVYWVNARNGSHIGQTSMC